ncbi:AraC family transcriptional regulator protein [Christiangramia flava JLT2011]|nr:AraC family transcriptional regulator protein [Christiangramia flava JLT2011]
MAKGNFDFQIECTNRHDELEGLMLLLNLTVQKLKKNRNQFLWLNKDREFVKIQTACFLLDSDYRIVHFQSEMEYLKEKFENLPEGEKFSAFLTEESKNQWSKSIINLKDKKQWFLILPLNYSFQKSLQFSLHSVIAKVTCKKSEFYLVYSSQPNLEQNNLFNVPEIKSNDTISIWDQQLFQDIHSYIENHLEKPLISYYDLASLFNTNEHKIKVGFKEVYGLTPFQLHREKRIERSKILIANTDLFLTEIAEKMGFSTYPQFSKTFKIITGISPRTYKK